MVEHFLAKEDVTGSNPVTRSKDFCMEYNLDTILLNMLGSEELVQQWWATPNKAFSGEIPDDIFHSDRRGEVIGYILRHAGYWV